MAASFCVRRQHHFRSVFSVPSSIVHSDFKRMLDGDIQRHHFCVFNAGYSALCLRKASKTGKNNPSHSRFGIFMTGQILHRFGIDARVYGEGLHKRFTNRKLPVTDEKVVGSLLIICC